MKNLLFLFFLVFATFHANAQLPEDGNDIRWALYKNGGRGLEEGRNIFPVRSQLVRAATGQTEKNSFPQSQSVSLFTYFNSAHSTEDEKFIMLKYLI